MALVASAPPTRDYSGSTPDAVFQPLADSGAGNPFFYHVFADDFDASLATATNYTLDGTGSAALTPGDGGLALFSTLAGAGTFAGIQTPVAGFTVSTIPKKVFWEARMQLSAVSTMTLIAGLTNTQAAPATPVAPVNGVYFSKAAGTLQLVGNVTVASATVSVNIPLAALTLVNATFFDLGIYITRFGDVLFYVDSQLAGFVPQSNIATTNGPQNAGAVARLTAPTLPTANLAPTLLFSNGATAAIATATVDFHQAQKER